MSISLGLLPSAAAAVSSTSSPSCRASPTAAPAAASAGAEAFTGALAATAEAAAVKGGGDLLKISTNLEICLINSDANSRCFLYPDFDSSSRTMSLSAASAAKGALLQGLASVELVAPAAAAAACSAAASTCAGPSLLISCWSDVDPANQLPPRSCRTSGSKTHSRMSTVFLHTNFASVNSHTISCSQTLTPHRFRAVQGQLAVVPSRG